MSTTIHLGDLTFPSDASYSASVELVSPSQVVVFSDVENVEQPLPVVEADLALTESRIDIVNAKTQQIDENIDQLTASILQLAWPQQFPFPANNNNGSRSRVAPAKLNFPSSSANCSNDADSLFIVQHSMRRLVSVQNNLIDATRAAQLEVVKNSQVASGTPIVPSAVNSNVPGFLVPASLQPQMFAGVAVAHKLLPITWMTFFYRHMAILNAFHDAMTGLALGISFLVLFGVLVPNWVWLTFFIHILIEAPYLFLLLNIDLAKRLLCQFDVLFLCGNWCVLNFFCLPDLFGWDIRSLLAFANAPTAILNILGDASAGEITRKHHKLRTIMISSVLIFSNFAIRYHLFHDIAPRSINMRWLEISTDALFVTCTTNIIVFSLRFVYNIWQHPESLLTLKVNVERSDLGRSETVHRWTQILQERNRNEG